MEKSKLLKILQTFSVEELRELGKFGANRMFNHRPEALALLKILQKTILAGQPLPSREKIFQQLFKREVFDYHRVRMAMSALLITAEKYLVVRNLLQDKPAYQERLSKILQSMGLHTQANQSWQHGMAALQLQELRNSEYHYDLYKFEEEKFRATLETSEAGTADLQSLSDQLDLALLARKLSQGCFLLAHQARYNTPCNFDFLDQILPFAVKYLHDPAISMYYHCYLAFTQPHEIQHFQAFKKELLAHDTRFPPEELRDLYILAINICTRRYNEGDLSFLQDQFELYRIGFEKNYFYSGGVLSRFTYLNAATIGLVVQEYDWVENFIQVNQKYLDPAFQESLFSFNMARLEYQKRNLGAALQLLQRAEYKETMLALAAKTIQLKIYYESNEFDLLESHLQAITAFIRRKKVMGYHRENYLNLVQLVRRILERPLSDKKEKQAFRELIQQTRPLAEKAWLLLQV